MPIKIKFQERISKLHTYSCIFGEKTIVHADWLPLILDWEPRLNPESDTFGDEHREEAALYLGFAWNLSQGLDHFVTPIYYRDDAAKRTQLPFDFINWEYRVDIDHLSMFKSMMRFINGRALLFLFNLLTKDLIADKGFIPARNCVQVSPPPSVWQEQHRHEAGLFHIQTLTELGKLHQALLADATSEINIFCLKPGRSMDLLSFLTAPTKPDLSKFLKEGEIFIDIVLGIDMGYRDSILIKSSQDIGSKIRSLSLQYEQAVSEYEYASFQFQALEPAFARLNELAQGKTTNQL
ncbi:MAG: hypothetical protein L6461_06355 [Anaerolineae bacterium]|nr:hypothetical protein [Anaerolineae bacterium]